MFKLLIFASLLLISNCGRETKEKVYLPKIEFERTKNPNYKNYFPQAEITKQTDKKAEIIEKNTSSEPLPSFTSISTKKDPPEKEKSAGIFDFLFGNTDSENEGYSYEAICEEILDINNFYDGEEGTVPRKKISDGIPHEIYKRFGWYTKTTP